ncbi:MAG: glycosyltransferase family protein [Phycisphaerae bacterium]
MPLSFQNFLQQRRPFQLQFFPAENATHTIAIASYIWWTDHIGFSLLNAGYNVLFCIPLYLLYSDPQASATFNKVWDDLLLASKKANVSLLIGGNTSALCPHRDTGQLLHNAANIPVVHYWWDEPRTNPHYASHFSPDDYLAHLRDPRTLNCIWDLDVLEELQSFHNLHNSHHLPLATLPEFWTGNFLPLQHRPISACFLGNCHFTAEWADTDTDPLTTWARTIVSQKQANLDLSMRDAIAAAGPPPLQASRHLPHNPDPWAIFRIPWEVLNAVWMHRTRNRFLHAAANHLGKKLALVGKGWQNLGLLSQSEHAKTDSGLYYRRSQASLNLFGGCVHGGMPLRPFDIAASSGLLLTHYNRELPALFEPNKECLAFRTQSEMLDQLDRLLSHPADFNPLPLAAHRRLLSHHTWSHRLHSLLTAAQNKLNWPS